jgi:hypothetical protein
MKVPGLSLEEATSFGILPEDEGAHPYDPDVEWWNESWFWDFFNGDGTVAGHCRIGMHPVQRRVWFWFFLYVNGEWIVLEEPRLPLADLQLPRLAYRGWGLEFSWDPSQALRRGRLRFHGFGRVVSGPRVGQIQEMGADLEISAIGAAHTTGRGDVAGHSSERFDACRFEQPIALQGELMSGGQTSSFEGRGERDHSWGPRVWNMEWTIVVANREDMRFLCTDVRIPGLDPIKIGYFHTEGTENLSDVDLDFEFDDDAPLSPVKGELRITTAGGEKLAFRLEVITGAEINLTHVLDPPRRPIYRRALIRLQPEDDGEPLIGWYESHRSVEPA